MRCCLLMVGREMETFVTMRSWKRLRMFIFSVNINQDLLKEVLVSYVEQSVNEYVSQCMLS